MEIKYKLYPYPVLSSYSNDYGTGAFDVAIDIVRDGYDLRIDFLATLTCQSLQDCIKQGVAKFVYHLECSQTGFRTVVQTDKVSEVYTLLNKAVNGKLQICPFVVAVDDLKGFTSPDESCKQMLVDMSQRKIIIKLPLSDFYSYKALSATPLAQPILNSLTVVPALVYVLEELRALPIQERSENSDTLWYKVLSKALLTQFDCDIESEEFNNQNCLILAQKLINNPVTDAFTFLTSSFGAAGGDE